MTSALIIYAICMWVLCGTVWVLFGAIPAAVVAAVAVLVAAGGMAAFVIHTVFYSNEVVE